MAWNGLPVLAVVPARGGSKGIPRKNLQTVGGLSLIAHAAAVARSLSWIDRAIISTDDPEMAEEGRTHGLEVPFLRPAELAQDESNSVDMWRHAWLASERHFGVRFELSVLLQPTTPGRIPGDVERTAKALVDGGHHAATTVNRVPGHYTPEKILQLDGSGVLRPYLAEGVRHSQRQTIPPYYYRNGICYAVTRHQLVDCGQIVEEDCVAVLIDRHVVNIDDLIELELARYFHGRLEPQ